MDFNTMYKLCLYAVYCACLCTGSRKFSNIWFKYKCYSIYLCKCWNVILCLIFQVRYFASYIIPFETIFCLLCWTFLWCTIRLKLDPFPQDSSVSWEESDCICSVTHDLLLTLQGRCTSCALDPEREHPSTWNGGSRKIPQPGNPRLWNIPGCRHR